MDFRENNISTRKKIIATCLACGFVPFKCVGLLNENSESIQHHIANYIKRGELEKYKENDIWFVTITDDTKKKILEADPENSRYDNLYFDKILTDHYLETGLDNIYRLKAKKPKIDEEALKEKGTSTYEIRKKRKSALENYKKAESRKQRLMMNASAFTFFYGADFSSLPGDKPLINELKEEDINENGYFYSFKELIGIESKIYKSYANIKNSAVTNTKVNGVFITNDMCYTTIVTNKDLYRFSKDSELNAKTYISNITTGTISKPIDGCILIYGKEAPIIKMIKRETANPRLLTDNLYEAYKESNVFALPLTSQGQKMAKIMCIPNWKRLLNDMVIPEDWQTKTNQYVMYDGMQTEENKPTVYHFNFLNPDLTRLKRFLSFADANHLENNFVYVIHCYDVHTPLLKSAVEKYIKLHEIKLDAVYEKITR